MPHRTWEATRRIRTGGLAALGLALFARALQGWKPPLRVRVTAVCDAHAFWTSSGDAIADRIGAETTVLHVMPSALHIHICSLQLRKAI